MRTRTILSSEVGTLVAAILLSGCSTDIEDPPGMSPPPTIIGGMGQVLVPGGSGNWVPAGGRDQGSGGTNSGASPGTAGAAGGGIIVAGGMPGIPPAGSPSPMDLQGAPTYNRFMRLTNEQWERSVQDLLKLPNPPDQAKDFEQPVEGATDFTNNEHNLTINQAIVDQYQKAAEAVTSSTVLTDAAIGRIHSGTDAAAFVSAFGRRAFRRPLTATEVQKYQALFTTGSMMTGSGSAFTKGASLVIQAMLQSPNYLYRSELSPKGAPLNGYEIASKISFIIRGSTPTDADLDEARDGKLDSPEGAAALATRMLEEPAAAEVFKRFHGEMLDFSQFNAIDKINVPEYTTALNAQYQESAYLFFDRIYKKNLGLKDILTSTIGFVSPALAPLYGVTVTGSGFVEKDLGPDRPGYFTQLPYLTMHALNLDPDSVLRGKDINLGLLCITLGPPAEIPPIPALQPGQTNRERMTALTGGCGGSCHNDFLNPIGFAFENYDGMGRLRTTDNGKPIDTSGAYPFSEGTKTFTGAKDLMAIIAQSNQANACYSKKLASFMLQRDIVATDVPMLETLKETSKAGSVKQLIIDLVKNPAFRTRAQ